MSIPLLTEHTALGAVMTTVGPETVPLHYGDPVAEHNAVRSRVGVADLSHRGVWHLRGPDATRFLQGTLSNDIAALGPGEGCYALSLTGRGKIISDLVVLRRKEGFLMHAPAETREAGFASLERFLIGDDAELTDETGRIGIIGVYGPACRETTSLFEEALPELPEFHFAERNFEGEPILLAAAFWTGEKGIELLAPASILPALWAALTARAAEAGGRPVGDAALDSLRLEAGIPRGGTDFDEETLPQSAALERALSHTKGCYRGQEIVLRVHTKGEVKHVLRGLVLDEAEGSLPARGTKLLIEGEERGWVTRAVHSPTLGKIIGLAYLQKPARTPGTSVRLDSSPPRTATVTSLPFYHRG